MASPGRPLPGPLLAAAEPYFQNDKLSTATLHDNPVAQRATEALGAQAMTVGTQIFAAPEAVGNMRLMGHELSHVSENLKGTRETGNGNGAGVTVTDPRQGSEQAAERDGASFAAGATTAPSVTAQRATSPGAGGAGEALGAGATVQRSPSGYGWGRSGPQTYQDDDAMVIDAEPSYAASYESAPVAYSSWTLPPGRWDEADSRQERPSYPYGDSPYSSRPPAPYQGGEDVDMDMDMDEYAAPAPRGRRSSRPPASYDTRGYDVVDADPRRRGSSRQPDREPRRTSRPPTAYQGGEDREGYAPRGRRSSRPPTAYDTRGYDVVDAAPRRRGSSRHSSRPRTAYRGPDDMDVDMGGPSESSRSGWSGPESSRRERSNRKREMSSSRPKGVVKSGDRALKPRKKEQLWDVANEVIAKVKSTISKGAANQVSAAVAGGLGHRLGVARSGEYRQPVPSGPMFWGQSAAAAKALGVGNCGEHAAMAFCMLNKKKLPEGVRIWHVEMDIDHVFVAVGYPSRPQEIIIVDPWQVGAGARAAGDPNLHFRLFDERGNMPKKATAFTPDGVDYMKLAASTINTAEMQNTMDLGGDPVPLDELMRPGQGMYHQQMTARPMGAPVPDIPLPLPPASGQRLRRSRETREDLATKFRRYDPRDWT
nr:DUF4157 domain-containing protein [Streptomyces spiramenti]